MKLVWVNGETQVQLDSLVRLLAGQASVAVREMSRIQTLLVDAQVEVERLRAEVTAFEDFLEDTEALKAQLAAANALLEELSLKVTIPYTDEGNGLAKRVQAHLAEQPAAVKP